MSAGAEDRGDLWTVRLEGPADEIRYLAELADAEGVEVRVGPRGRDAEVRLPAGHPLAATLLASPEAGHCTAVVLTGNAAVEPRRRRPEEVTRSRSRPLAAAAWVLALAAAAAAWAPAPALTGPDPRLRTGPAPQAREGMSAAIDGRGELVLFGGIAAADPTVDLGDTWTRTGGVWRLRRPPVSPSPRFDAVMADDPAAGAIVLFGGRRRGPGAGLLEDTWSWDGETWSRRHTAAAPPAGAAALGLAYDAAERTLVLVTAGPAEPQTWTLSDGGWSPHSGTGTPALGWMAPAPDGAVIAVGRPDGVNRGATWRWDGSRWERLAPATAVRVEPLSAVLAYDPTTRRTLLVEVEFQGVDGAQAGGTWAWDGETWAEHHSVPAVVAAFGVTEPVVAAGRPLTLLGGPQDSGAYRDAWAWDGGAWRRS